MPFLAPLADGHGEDRESILLAFRFATAQKSRGLRAVPAVLGQIRQSDRERIANLFSFNRFADFQTWIRAVLPIAYDLERLAPDLANDGPNPEYPWPHAQPHTAPVDHDFALWTSLKSGQGRDLMRVIHIAVSKFPQYADT